MNSHINPHWIVVDVEPSIALARAECLDTFRRLPAQKSYSLMREARMARSMYQRELLRQFTKFLVSFVRSARHRGLNYTADLQPSMSAASPRGA
jgi:hypothetical protein